MNIQECEIAGVYQISLQPRGDHRGYFMRTYDEKLFAQAGLKTHWVQENQSKSAKRGTIRGMHFQRGSCAETKVVRVLSGAVLDVAVDVRRGSGTFGKYVAVELSDANQMALYIPRGFAHGFCTLTDDAIVAYKVDNFFAPESEGGLLWNAPEVNIPWPDFGTPQLSEKDALLPGLSKMEPVDL